MVSKKKRGKKARQLGKGKRTQVPLRARPDVLSKKREKDYAKGEGEGRKGKDCQTQRKGYIRKGRPGLHRLLRKIWSEKKKDLDAPEGLHNLETK